MISSNIKGILRDQQKPGNLKIKILTNYILAKPAKFKLGWLVTIASGSCVKWFDNYFPACQKWRAAKGKLCTM